ncbi:molybdate ABC transporter substrate-binding protein [Virgibacillus sp. MSP4-1]|uniref:molybdate ABC transporter substrate-binding protein n=1 Tax=Virgibacillus sp. MSP4-1 TaxID=2700081 RepID=UPI0003A33217|nr:molybdate ABC transporter substrate-binding protein [Virgibacillus sp. MSP4-1]QHS22490.1 molybdate ABC transporter substrate-binding protein [Virgibacillus sp. MSP4-1]
MKRFVAMLMGCLIIISGCTSNGERDKTEVTVSAASSMSESLQEVIRAFEHEYPSIRVHLNTGGTGTLRRQIEQGAPIDLFFSASERDYQRVKQQDFVKEGNQLLTNSLVLIKSEQASVRTIDELLRSDRKLAIGTPESVPAGTYAKEVLRQLNKWERLEDQLVFTKDVTQVLTLVNKGTADLGIVYISDADLVENVTAVREFDTALHSPIKYYLAMLKDDNQKDKAIKKAKDAFYQFAQSETAEKIYKRHGFIIKG